MYDILATKLRKHQGAFELDMEFGIIGTSIWQQNMPLLEKLTVANDDKAVVLEKLKEALGVSELIYLSTCNRVEFIFAAPKNGTDLPHFYQVAPVFGRVDNGFD